MNQPTTTAEYLAYYSSLLPSQYGQQPNAVATIQLLAALALMPQGGNVLTDNEGNILFDNEGNVITDSDYGELMGLALGEAFNINNAVGQQLQFLGLLVGVEDSGYNLSGQYVTLSDDDYRKLILAVAGWNQLRGTNQAVDVFINQYFNGILTYTDQLNMGMSFTYLPVLGSVLWAELFITGKFLPRPLGVQANIVYTFPVTGPFFSFIGEDQAAPWANTVGLDSETGSLVGYVMVENWQITFPY